MITETKVKRIEIPQVEQIKLKIAESLRKTIFPEIMVSLNGLGLTNSYFSHDTIFEVTGTPEFWIEQQDIIDLDLIFQLYYCSHLLKSEKSYLEKRVRHGDKHPIYDEMRTTLILENRVNEEQVLQMTDAIYGVFYKNPISIDGKECPWFVEKAFVKPIYRNSGYSDLTLVIGVWIDGVLYYFELKINTKEFVDISTGTEHEIYDRKKELVLKFNEAISTIGYIFGLSPRCLKIEDMDKIVSDLWGNLSKYSSQKTANRDYKPSDQTISNLLRRLCGYSQKSKQIEKLQIDFYTNPKDYPVFYKNIAEIINKFTLAFFETRKMYIGLDGVVNSSLSAAELHDKIIGLPNYLLLAQNAEQTTQKQAPV